MVDHDHWHPSGRTPVYDVHMDLAGYTTLRIAVEDFTLSKESDGERQYAGAAKRVLLEVAYGAPYWIYWVHEGDPAEMPEFIKLPL